MCVYLCVCSFWPVSDQPICGNQIVEEGEECDVGQNDTDLCCFSAKQPVGVQCRLKPGKVCRYMTFIVYLIVLITAHHIHLNCFVDTYVCVWL